MGVHREHLPVLAATLVAPVLALGAVLALPDPGRNAAPCCPRCGHRLTPESAARLVRHPETTAVSPRPMRD